MRRGSFTVVNLGGCADAALIVEVVHALQQVEGDSTALIVDLSDVAFSDGECLGGLLESLERLDVDRRLHVVPGGLMSRAMLGRRHADRLPLYGSVSRAVARVTSKPALSR